MKKRRVSAAVLLAAAALWLCFFPAALLPPPYGALIYDLFASLFSALAVLCLLPRQGGMQPCRRAPRRLVLAASVAAYAVALCNLPWIPLLRGSARITAPWPAVLLFALLCLAVGALEEAVFRGILLPQLAERLLGRKNGRFLAVLLSSLAFGLVHLFNLFAGADPAATFLQVGYSFLIGCAAAVLFLLSHRLLPCVLFHALYNFGGLLLPRLGAGSAWDAPTVILTVCVGIAAAAILSFSFFCGERTRENAEKT